MHFLWTAVEVMGHKRIVKMYKSRTGEPGFTSFAGRRSEVVCNLEKYFSQKSCSNSLAFVLFMVIAFSEGTKGLRHNGLQQG